MTYGNSLALSLYVGKIWTSAAFIWGNKINLQENVSKNKDSKLDINGDE